LLRPTDFGIGEEPGGFVKFELSQPMSIEKLMKTPPGHLCPFAFLAGLFLTLSGPVATSAEVQTSHAIRDLGGMI
jgi:hypothetical protein